MAARHSPTSYYSALPQAPAGDNAIESLDVDVEDEDMGASIDSLQSTEVSGAIRWIHFVLGCVVLLPWNGEIHVLLRIIRG